MKLLRTEMYGFLTILVLFFGYNIAREHYQRKNRIYPTEDVYRLLDSLICVDEAQSSKEYAQTTTYQKKKKFNRKIVQKALQLRPFDPNTVTREELERMEIPRNVTKTWLNYRSKGARFYSKTDMKKIYGLEGFLLDSMMPYISFPKKYKADKKDKKIRSKPDTAARLPPRSNQYARAQLKNNSININTADSFELRKIPYIGRFRARSIVKQRERLGGFASYDLVKTTYGIPDSVFQFLAEYTYLTKPTLSKININEFAFEEIEKYPILYDGRGYRILNIRREIGSFKTVEELLSISRDDSIMFSAFLPYFEVD